MPRVATSRLTKKKATTRRRGTSTLTRAKYKPKTTAANRSLIRSNALAIRAIKRIMPQPVYTDWQYSGVLIADSPDASFSQSLKSVQLMSPSDGGGSPFWQPVLRQDDNVTQSSSTRILRMQLNLRYRLQVSNWCQFTVFVVSPRKDAVDRVFNSGGLIEGQDYIYNPDDFNVRVNPAVMKVHYCRNVSLTKNSWLAPAVTIGGGTFAGNPQTTMARGQVNIKLGFNIRQPNQGLPWTSMDQSQFGPTQRYFLLAFMVQQNNLDGTPDAARVTFDTLYTCYNAS